MNQRTFPICECLRFAAAVFLLCLLMSGFLPAFLQAAELSFGEARQITEGPGGYHPRWSPDCSQITYVSGDWPDIQIYLIPAGGGEPTLVPIDRSGDLSLTWHPDGHRIAFDAYKDDTSVLGIFEVDLESGVVSRLTNLPGGAFGPSWRSDGQRIAFSYNGNIYSLASDGTQLIRHTSHPALEWYQHYSPDGSHLAFASDRTGNGDVWLLELATGALTQFTSDPGMDSRAVWSPDGAWIAWTSNRTGSRQVYVKAVAGGEVIAVTQDYQDAGMPDWAPGGSSLCYVGDGQIWVVDVDGITATRKTSFGGLKTMFRSKPAR